MLYSEIATALEEIAKAPRSQKASIAASLLSEQQSPDVCISVRLLLGILWPPWEEREMGIGPESIMMALQEVSDDDVPSLRERLGEMGAVTMAALQHKSQNPLAREPLQAASVYERLMHISRMIGQDSEHRKSSILRGLFLEASPLEGMHIARTAMRSMQAGMGPQIMLAAQSRAFHIDQREIQRAYNCLPEMGLVAKAASLGETEGLTVKPMIPVRLMVVGRGEPKLPGVLLPKFAGLRVQLHCGAGRCAIFSSRLRDMTSSLESLQSQISGGEDMIIDADLIGFQNGEICSQLELIRHINRSSPARNSSVQPALLAYDLIYLGEDVTRLAYKDRRKRLAQVLGEPKKMPFEGISVSEERLLQNQSELDQYVRRMAGLGSRGLMSKDPSSPYCLGARSSGDFLVLGKNTQAAAAKERDPDGHDRISLVP